MVHTHLRLCPTFFMWIFAVEVCGNCLGEPICWQHLRKVLGTLLTIPLLLSTNSYFGATEYPRREETPLTTSGCGNESRFSLPFADVVTKHVWRIFSPAGEIRILFSDCCLIVSNRFYRKMHQHLQVAVSVNYRGVRWSGKSLSVSSEYKITLTST